MKLERIGPALRELTPQEIALVAGGDDVDGGEIVITASKEQVAAAWSAYNRASIEINMIFYQYVGMAAGLAWYTGSIYAAVGGAVGTEMASDARESLIETMAQYYYEQDAQDGIWNNYTGDAGIYVTP